MNRFIKMRFNATGSMNNSIKLFSFLFLLFFTSCGSHTVSLAVQQQDTTNAVQDTFTTQDPFVRDPLYGQFVIWSAEEDTASKLNFRLVKLRAVESDTLTPEKLISILNRQWRYVHISGFKVSHDTIRVTIPYCNVLTSNMGGTGALEYMATAVYTLTELKGINYVDWDFAEGEHLSPGTDSRKSFEGIVKE